MFQKVSLAAQTKYFFSFLDTSVKAPLQERRSIITINIFPNDLAAKL